MVIQKDGRGAQCVVMSEQRVYRRSSATYSYIRQWLSELLWLVQTQIGYQHI